jgi:hypothetical protein
MKNKENFFNEIRNGNAKAIQEMLLETPDLLHAKD